MGKAEAVDAITYKLCDMAVAIYVARLETGGSSHEADLRRAVESAKLIMFECDKAVEKAANGT